ncbi:hypothetical protein CC2G_010767 [Coprinopsis cinerea AmutBmut pab1-1]|nr:hypothetical protein CC2G_010767 [Coprinopsis cinerea AmutBmut pab1-1]
MVSNKSRASRWGPTLAYFISADPMSSQFLLPVPLPQPCQFGGHRAPGLPPVQMLLLLVHWVLKLRSYQ